MIGFGKFGCFVMRSVACLREHPKISAMPFVSMAVIDFTFYPRSRLVSQVHLLVFHLVSRIYVQMCVVLAVAR